MTRFPEPGKTKTRLIPALGPDRAANLHRCLIGHTLDVVSHWTRDHDCHVEVRYFGGDKELFRNQFGTQFVYRPPSEGPLGDRMNAAVAEAFADGTKRVVVIGTDCPMLDETHLTNAFQQLKDRDVVIGPATDGGYYLIIPAMNEAAQITDTLQRLINIPDVEIIVADGGSADRTVKLAQAAGASVVQCHPGRGKQMNAGATLAGGEVLLFLHADTQLPDGTCAWVLNGIASSSQNPPTATPATAARPEALLTDSRSPGRRRQSLRFVIESQSSP